jgi:starvation-inducible outer membrane lipoprotein
MALLALTACSSAPTAGIRKASDVNLSGFPPEYQSAFETGCDRARAGGKVSEAPTFRNAPAQTVQGWRDGFDICRRK